MPENHGWTHANGIDPIPSSPVVYAIKLTADEATPGAEVAVINNGQFYMSIPPELDGWYVVKFWGYQTTPGALGTDTLIRLKKFTPPSTIVTVTSTSLGIDEAGYFPNQDAVIDTIDNQVQAGADLLQVDIEDVNGAYGLACEISFSPVNVLL